jgi:SAM-dependent methyltransferase
MIFDESVYLKNYPDVADALLQGKFASGAEHYQLFGKGEGRSFLGPRAERVLTGLDLDGLGLEIGPSHNPIAPKRLGFQVHIVDHLDAEGLRKKYEGHSSLGVHTENIEDVDFVSRGEPLPELIGQTGCYDWIIASHVIEHLADPAEFFRECEQLLKPGGRLSLVVPDMRFCFDHFGAPSTTGAVLDAWHAGRTRPSPGQVFDHLANSVKRNGSIAWSHAETESTEPTMELLHSFELTARHWEIAQQPDTYIDSHCWRFVPESFRLIAADLVRLGMCKLNIATCSDTIGNEFFCQMTTDAPMDSYGEDRLFALKSIAQKMMRHP